MKTQSIWQGTQLAIVILVIGFMPGCEKKDETQQMTLAMDEAGGTALQAPAATHTLIINSRGHQANLLADRLSAVLQRDPELRLIRASKTDAPGNRLEIQADGDSLIATFTPFRRLSLTARSAELCTSVHRLIRWLPLTLHVDLSKCPTPTLQVQQVWAEACLALQNPSAKRLDKAIGQFKSTLKQDDAFTPAWRGLAEAYLLRHEAEAHPVWLNLAHEAALRVQQTSTSEGEVILARIAILRGDWRTGSAHLNTALANTPHHAQARALWGKLLLRAGLYARADIQLQYAALLRPDDKKICTNRGWTQLGLQHPLDAEQLFIRADTTDTRTLAGRALARLWQGDGAEALQLLQNGPVSLLLLSIKIHALITQHENDEALGLLDAELAPVVENDPGLALAAAGAYCRLERPGEAIKMLNKADTAGYDQYPWIEIDPFLEKLRKDERAHPVLMKIKQRWMMHVESMNDAG